MIWNTELQTKLRQLNACDDAIEWLGERSAEQAWAECERGDWMLWLIGKIEGKYTPAMRLCACEIVRTQLHLVPAGEERPRIAIETAERYASGNATADELQEASVAAEAAADTAAEAAEAAAWVAKAAAEAAVAAVWATEAAGAAAETAADAAEAAVWVTEATVLKSFADIVRKHFPTPPVI